MSRLAQQVVQISRALEQAKLPHAFGGALALAWCTCQARGTIDIDLNVFVAQPQSALVIDALPDGIEADVDAQQQLLALGQTRFWWQQTPVDIFVNTSDFHEAVAARIQWESFADHSLPFLHCQDLAVFKALYNRTKHWADVEAMVAASSISLAQLAGDLGERVGREDPRIQRLNEILKLHVRVD